jgi:uncharacterized protein (DUF433 family)
MAVATIAHIDVDEKGVARIAGSRIKVTYLVVEKRMNGWSPEQLQEQHPHLNLAQIHAAFAYYYDHQPELDAQIVAEDCYAEEMRQKAGESPLTKKLRAMGKIP